MKTFLNIFIGIPLLIILVLSDSSCNKDDSKTEKEIAIKYSHTITSSEGLGGSDVICIHVDGKDFYAGTRFKSGSDFGGLSISHDSGKTWNNLRYIDGLAYSEVHSIQVQGKTLYVGTGSGVSISQDDGENWTNYEDVDGLADNPIYDVCYNNGILYATAYEAGVFKTENVGLTWTKIFPLEFDVQMPSSTNILVKENIIIIGTSEPTLSYISKDKGNTWNTFNIFQLNDYDEYNGKIFAVGSGIFVSEDNGNNWTKIPNPNEFESPIHSIDVNENGIFIGSEQFSGIAVSTDVGENWRTYKGEEYGLDKTNKIDDIVVTGDRIYVAGDNGIIVLIY